MHGVEPALFRQLLGRFATGVTVLTARDAQGRPVGMTASSVASVSLHPPLLLVSVSHEHEMHAALLAAKHFTLNVLAADQEALSRRFAADHPDRFAGVGYRDNKYGVPVLDGVLASIECQKQDEVAGSVRRGPYSTSAPGSATSPGRQPWPRAVTGSPCDSWAWT